VGLPEILLDSVRRNELGDVVLLNADTNVLTTPHDDLNTLPQDVVSDIELLHKSSVPAWLAWLVARLLCRC
jgi:hypothetical protein